MRPEVAAALEQLPLDPTTIPQCQKCSGRLVTTKDAIGRPRLRCPKCDGVSRIKPHPDEVLIPQGLVRMQHGPALPLLKPRQFRCQWCAGGCAPKQRFCGDRCETAARQSLKRQPCRGCGQLFVPSAASRLRCASCLAAPAPTKVRLCAGCNRVTPRKAGPRTVSSCRSCRPPRASRAAAEANRASRPPRPAHTCELCREVIPPKRGRPPKICDACLTPSQVKERDYKRAWKPKAPCPQ